VMSSAPCRVCFALLLTAALLLPGSPGLPDSRESGDASGADSPHLVRTVAYWGGQWRDAPLHARVGPAPAEVLEYLQQDMGLDTPPEPANDQDLAALVGRALEDVAAQLPGHLATLLRDNLAAVLLARGIGSSGYVESVEAPGTSAGKHAFIVLDAAMMQGRAANAWASLRESSFFRPGPVRVTMTIAQPEQDDIFNGLRYILLHELGHCMGLFSGAHLDWMAPPKDAADVGPFVAFSWQLRDGRYTPRPGMDFPWRAGLRIYAFEDAALTAQQAPEVYADVFKRSNWTTLYAAASPFEDFAESFAVWQHAVREDRPWAVTVTRLDGSSQRWISCLETGSCRRKAAFMAELFEENE